MKNYEVRYSKGHLIDSKTGKRIFLKRGGRFLISGDDEQFEEKDELLIDRQPLSAKEKLLKLQADHKGFFLEKVAEGSKDRFVYRIGLSKRTSEERKLEFLFDALIYEDLYLKSKNGKDWSLCSCLCETTHCVDGDIQMFEPVKGTSLNNLFSNMVAFYFSLQRSGSTNAFTTFYYAEKADHFIHEVKNRSLRSLDDTRRQLINHYKNK